MHIPFGGIFPTSKAFPFFPPHNGIMRQEGLRYPCGNKGLLSCVQLSVSLSGVTCDLSLECWLLSPLHCLWMSLVPPGLGLYLSGAAEPVVLAVTLVIKSVDVALHIPYSKSLACWLLAPLPVFTTAQPCGNLWILAKASFVCKCTMLPVLQCSPGFQTGHLPPVALGFLLSGPYTSPYSAVCRVLRGAGFLLKDLDSMSNLVYPKLSTCLPSPLLTCN